MTYDRVTKIALGIALITATFGLACGAVSQKTAAAEQPKRNPQLTCKLAQIKTCAHVFPWYSIVEIDGKKYCLAWRDTTQTVLLINQTTKRFSGKEGCAAG
jgi:hypothetical protein